MTTSAPAVAEDYSDRFGRTEFGHGLRAALRVADPVEVEETPQPLDESISPELVLVCPELREQALAALPSRDPDAFLKPQPEPVLALLDPDAEESTPFRRLTLAAASYAALETGRAAAFGVLATGLVAGLAALATLPH
jgi:hypothetical protein